MAKAGYSTGFLFSALKGGVNIRTLPITTVVEAERKRFNLNNELHHRINKYLYICIYKIKL
jgi:hypothetical protein